MFILNWIVTALILLVIATPTVLTAMLWLREYLESATDGMVKSYSYLHNVYEDIEVWKVGFIVGFPILGVFITFLVSACVGLISKTDLPIEELPHHVVQGSYILSTYISPYVIVGLLLWGAHKVIKKGCVMYKKLKEL